MILASAFLPLLVTLTPPPAEKPMPAAPAPLLHGSAEYIFAHLQCEINHVKYVQLPQTYTVTEGGKEVTKTRKVTTPYLSIERRLVPVEGLKGFVVSQQKGKPVKTLAPLDTAMLSEWFGTRKPLLFSLEETVKPEQVKDAKEGTVVLILPKAEAPKPPEKK